MNPSTTSSSPQQRSTLDRFVVIAVSTTTDEHGVYVTKDSAEVIEIGWILVDAKSLEEVRAISFKLRQDSSWKADIKLF